VSDSSSRLDTAPPKDVSRRRTVPTNNTTRSFPCRGLLLSLLPLAIPLIISALAWGLLFLSLPPAQQNFPLNDDWAFGRGAFQLARGEGIHYGRWASMPLLGQWLWACPFLWLLGESHFALRVSTLALSWLGLWAFYDLLRQEGVSRPRASFATAVLALNPLFFLLQGTFMSDVPALALALIALALYGRALRRAGIGRLAAACLIATLAAITRQNTVGVSLAAVLLLWRERPLLLLWRERSLRGRPLWWLAVLLPALTGVAVHFWFQGRPDVRAQQLKLMDPPSLLQLPFVVIHGCGLAALPLLLWNPRLGSRMTFGIVAVLIGACAGYWLFYGAYLPYGGLFPYTENMLTPFGAFAGSRSTGLFIVGERPLLLGTAARVFMTLFGCMAGAILLTRVIRHWDARIAFQPLTLFTMLQIPFLLIVPSLYDRYLLFLLPGTLALAARMLGEESLLQRRWLLSGLSALALFGLVSVSLMHDWLSWNSARWELGRRALTRHINPRDIEGGVEWNGWYAPVGDASTPHRGLRWPVLPFTKDWFPSITGHYALSFSELKGTKRLDAESYSLWLLPGRRQFFLLELRPLSPQEAR
jgi:hypothetical protein